MNQSVAHSGAQVAQSTYDAAHEHFDAAPLRFWDRYGAESVRRARLRPGDRVLDLCAGTGASAIPAARAVGVSGRVVAVDVSAALLERARRKAEREGLLNIELRVADMTQLDFAEGTFDAIVLGFGLFFAPDMGAQVRALHRMLRPGGLAVVTTWGPRLFEPLYSPFLASARMRRPALAEYRPWDLVTTVEAVNEVMSAAPFAEVNVDLVAGELALERPEDWWTIVLGTGLRWFVDELDSPAADAVRAECLRHAQGVGRIETNVIHAVARK